MITEDMLMYMLFHLILFVLTLIGWNKIPILLLFVILADAIVAIPTAYAFEDYPYIGLTFLLLNCVVPVLGVTRAIKD